MYAVLVSSYWAGLLALLFFVTALQMRYKFFLLDKKKTAKPFIYRGSAVLLRGAWRTFCT
jgi:hypothetical protein